MYEHGGNYSVHSAGFWANCSVHSAGFWATKHNNNKH